MVALSDFTSCELSDALIKLGLPHGGYMPDINLISTLPSDTTICGPAYTVQMVLASDTNAPKLTEHFVDTAKADSIIVVSAPPNIKNAVWGGLMSAGAIGRSARGVVISGRCRDITEHGNLGFPVFSKGHSTLGQSPFTRPSAIEVPITISQDDLPAVTVNPGDIIVGDKDGVVCVPKDLVEKVVELADLGRKIDALCLQDIITGKGVQASFKEHRGKTRL